MELTPIIYGFLAGITVYLGAIPIVILKTRNTKILGTLTTIAAGILLFLAMEIGHEVEELVSKYARIETLDSFIIGLSTVTISILGVFLSIQYFENKFSNRIKSPSLLMASTAAIGLGLHNVGEGFGIAAALLSGSVVSAILFTFGFAVHNATEGFGIAGALQLDQAMVFKDKLKYVGLLSAVAGLPVLLGSSTYYIGSLGDIYLAILFSASAAAVLYATIKMIVNGSGKTIGYGTTFWIALFLGLALAYITEIILEMSFSE